MNLERVPIENENASETLSQKEIFMGAYNKRINELVQEGRMPKAYAESRSRYAEGLETGFRDPERQGIEFAEIGIEAIEEFQNKVREIEEHTGKSILSPFEDRASLEKEDNKFDQLAEDIVDSINNLRDIDLSSENRKRLESLMGENYNPMEVDDYMSYINPEDAKKEIDGLEERLEKGRQDREQILEDFKRHISYVYAA